MYLNKDSGQHQKHVLVKDMKTTPPFIDDKFENKFLGRNQTQYLDIKNGV